MQITQATLPDAELIFSLEKIVCRSEAIPYNDYTLPPFSQTLEEIKQQFSCQTFFKAVERGHLIGSVRAYLNEGTSYISQLMVHPMLRGKGIGTTLMYTIEKVFTDAKRYELFTGARSERSIRLYQRLGYEIFKTEPVNDRVTLVYLEKFSRLVHNSKVN